MNNTYNTDSIQSLGILGGVRAKPASIGLESHSHTFVEVLMNSIDEYREGYGDKIIVTKYKDNSISVQDFGRSLPMDKNSQGQYAYKKIFEEMWAGGKYKNNSKGNKGNYKWSCGTNGCGDFGACSCSDFLEATAFAQNNKQYHIRYEKGIQVGEFEETVHNLDHTGTIIHWIPSKEVFKGDNDITKEFICEILQQQAITNDNLKFIYKDENTNEELIYYYPNGAIDYIRELDKNNTSLTDIIRWTTEGEGRENQDDEIFAIKSNITFTFNNDINLIQYYHNSSFLENGGTPQDFIKNGFIYAIDKYISEKNLYKNKEKKITFEDIQDSLIILSDTYSTISLYTDQAKKKIKSKFMQSHVTDFLREQLYIYFTENSIIAEKVCNQILINKRAREHSEDTKKNLKKKLSEKITIINKIPNLYESESTDKEENILCICEGKSALSSLIVGRREVHAIFPLRGKILNCLKASPESIFSNEVIRGLMLALGCGVEFKSKKNKDLSTFDENNLRYSKIYIFVDADVDGIGSIMPLLLTMFYTLTPTLVNQNRICICESPKYEIDFGDEEYFAVNDEELQEVKNKLDYENNKNKIKIHYIKGLSELSTNAMSMCLAEDYKNIKTITLEDIEKSAKTIELFMSTEVKPRKEYILENFDKIGGILE